MGQFEARFIDDSGNEYRAVKCLISTQTNETSGQYIDLDYALQEVPLSGPPDNPIKNRSVFVKDSV